MSPKKKKPAYPDEGKQAQKARQTQGLKEKKPWSKLKTALILTSLFVMLPIIFLGKSLIPSSMLFGTDFTAGAYMSYRFCAEILSKYHTIPLWQPYVYGGVPYVEPTAGYLFYPLSWLLRPFWGSPNTIHTLTPWFYLIHFILAGLFTYLLLREFGLGRIAASLSGFGYMFTGQIVSLIYAGHDGKIAVSCLLPGFFWLVLRAVRLGRWREYVWAGGLFGCILLSPSAQMAYYSLLAVGLFWLIFLFLRWRKEKKKSIVIKGSAGLAIVLVLGIGLAAVQYIPFYSYIPYSPRGGGEGRGIEFAKSWSMPPEETLDALIPDFSGMSLSNTPYDTYWGRNFFKLHSEYLGVLPVLLAILGIVLGRKERYVVFFIVLLVLGLLFAWGGFTPFFYLYYYFLPYFKKLRASGMAFFLVSFSLSCLAGFGAEILLKRREGINPSKGSESGNKRLFLGLGIAAGISLLFALLVSGARDGLIQFLGNFLVSESQKYQLLQANYDHFVSGTFLMALFFVLQVVLLYLMLKNKIPKAWWAGLAIGLMIIDLWRIEFRYRQIVPPPPQYFETDEVVRVIEKDSSLYRVFPLEYDKMGNYLMFFGIQNILGEHGNQLQRYNEFVGAGKTSMVDGHNLRDKPNILDLLNVKYLIAVNRAEDFVGRAGFVLPRLKLISDGNFKVYENLDVLPRAFCVKRYEVISDPNEILNRIGQADFNPGRTVILEEDPGFSLAPKDSGRAEVRITSYTPNEVRLSTEAIGTSLLVFCENFYPSWKSYVDGQPSKLYRADYTFRAVPLPAGRHEVILRFESKQFRLGLTISLLALLILAAVTLTSIVKGKSPA